MRYTLRIALRYIFTKRSFHFITVISIISLIGIVIGVAALISVLSIFNGFREFTEKQLIGFDPHIRIISNENTWINNTDSLIMEIKKLDEIKSIAPVIQGRIIGINGNNMQVFSVNAIDPKDLLEVSGIEKNTISGNFYLGDIDNTPSIVLGVGIADRIKAIPGDTISLISPKLIESSIKSFRITTPIPVIVSGIFQTNAKDFDNVYAFIPAEIGKKLFKPPLHHFTSIDIKIKDIQDVNNVQTKIRKIIPAGIDVLTWYDLHKQIYDIMNFERTMAFVIMSLIIIIAAFNILASLAMTVVEKRSDIGILKSMGASYSDIRNIFIFQGTIIGILSTFLGVAIGLGFCFGQINYGWFSLDGSNFLITAIPVAVNAIDVIIISCFSLILSVLATIYPAIRAAKTIVIHSIRAE